MKSRIETRREFIRQAAMAAGSLTFLNACRQHEKSLKSPLDSSALKKFKAKFSGQIIIPGEAAYEKARSVRTLNPGTDKYPAILAQCKSEQDVLRSIDFAHQQKLEVSVRSGNHSFLCWGTCDKGIVIDLSGMKGVTIDPAKKTAQVHTGNTAEEILAATAPYGLAPVLGECGTVGAGIALGGGLGWLSGKYGATCDNLISARVITANGRILDANNNFHRDLFWALRGGGGNFGVATSFGYQLHPVNNMLAGTFTYPDSRARDLLRFFRDFMATAPDELQADFFLMSTDKRTVSAQFVYTGDLAKGEQLIDKFRKFEKPEQDSMKRSTFSEVYKMELTEGASSCPYQSAKGSYIEYLSDEMIDLLIDRFNQSLPSCEVGFNLTHYMHGEVCRVASDATAFVHRKPAAVHLASWVLWKDAANASACMSWHDKTFNLLLPYSGDRVYANYMSTTGESTAKKVYAGNYPRLVELKKKFDPENFFHLNQNIQPI